jgi:hypothetical protein
MKSSSLFFPVMLAAASLARAQENLVPASARIAEPSTAQILGSIPDGTPPTPAPLKLEYVVAARDVIHSTTHQQGGRTITIRQIKPIALPPPPAPAQTAGLTEEFRQRLAEYREAHPRTGMLMLSATVYLSRDSPPRTLVRCWPEGHHGEITFWSGADFSLIAGGVNSFADTAGYHHYLVMGWGTVDIDRMTDLRANKGLLYQTPPNFPAGPATFQIVGPNPPAEHLTAIQSLHDIYNNRLPELTSAYHDREQARLAKEAYLKANPPQPQDITLNYWRTKRPATNRKGEAK